jgi:hypothetical protein
LGRQFAPVLSAHGAAVVLAANASRYMTGSVVTADGGFLLN